ncbi:cell division protein FtsA [Candidatus Nanosyncoccus alces]|uniref:Cell division protein FtsA n=1 Tax=Candidatus Nanosyncoccus alces TaxID=2171997 RepID=A0ABY0FLL3_9BACT|nr:cell division protein FtsA [Candidatus Nanosyncoccus alces]RYC74681.1 Cell division protein FtsA [Candidatus Nanosyncoccus alces]
MDNDKRFVTGLDVGTENIRAVIASVDKDGHLAVVGYNEGKSAGMRKGVPANLAGPASAIDKMLGEAERMGGYDVRNAYVSINGSSILSTRTEGMIAVGTVEHEINGEDLDRVEDVAVSGRIPANRDVLDVVPLEYALDGQGGIKDPLGMSGARLEMRACVVSALTPNCENLKKATAAADVQAERLVPSVISAAKAVLSDRQKENGVAVIDMGAATTSVAVYEEGDLQYVGVVPAGSNNVTNDLAIVLAIDPSLAEEIKQRFVTGNFDTEKSPVIKIGREGKDERVFDRKEVEEVVKARLDEIFGEIRKKLKAAKYDQRLPEGIILVGGGAKMRDIDLFAKKSLEAAVKIGTPKGLGGVSDAIEKPEFATAVGLAMLAAEEGQYTPVGGKKAKKGLKMPKTPGLLKKLFSKF